MSLPLIFPQKKRKRDKGNEADDKGDDDKKKRRLASKLANKSMCAQVGALATDVPNEVRTV